MVEKCPCLTDVQSCCACVSMHCDECHKPNHSKFVQGRFCSNCGRPLKAELIQAYVPKSEVKEISGKYEDLKLKYLDLAKDHDELLAWGGHLKRAERAEIEKAVARKIFDDIANMMVLQHGFNEKHIVAHIDFELLKELKKKYTKVR